MNYTKIRLPDNEDGSRAFAELARRFRVVGVRESGEVVYQVPEEAIAALDESSLPYEVLEVELAAPAGPAGRL